MPAAPSAVDEAAEEAKRREEEKKREEEKRRVEMEEMMRAAEGMRRKKEAVRGDSEELEMNCLCLGERRSSLSPAELGLLPRRDEEAREASGRSEASEEGTG